MRFTSQASTAFRVQGKVICSRSQLEASATRSSRGRRARAHCLKQMRRCMQRRSTVEIYTSMWTIKHPSSFARFAFLLVSVFSARSFLTSCEVLARLFNAVRKLRRCCSTNELKHLARTSQGRNPDLRSFEMLCARFEAFCACFARAFFGHQKTC